MTTKYNIVIDSISSVFGGWDSGYYVDVSFHRSADGANDGYENTRVGLDREKVYTENPDDCDGAQIENSDYILSAIRAKIGETEDVESE